MNNESCIELILISSVLIFIIVMSTLFFIAVAYNIDDCCTCEKKVKNE